MESHVVTGSALAVQTVARAGMTERFVALLHLPGADPEVHEAAVLLHAALEAAWQTDQVELLTDALDFVRGRLVVRGLSDATCDEIAAALETAATATLSVEDRRSVHALLDRCASSPTPSLPPEPPALGPRAAAYVERLVQGDRAGAVALARRCVTAGMDIDDVILDILEPAQH